MMSGHEHLFTSEQVQRSLANGTSLITGQESQRLVPTPRDFMTGVIASWSHTKEFNLLLLHSILPSLRIEGYSDDTSFK